MIRDSRTGLFFAAAIAFLAAAQVLAGAGINGRNSTGPRSAHLFFHAPAAPAGSAAIFSPDKGKFRITINGQQVGSEEFDLTASGEAWTARSSTTAHAPGASEIKASGQLRLAADGSPLRYDWTAEVERKATGYVDFSGATAKCSSDFGGRAPLRKDFTFTSPHVVVLDNNLYYQYAILARLYDWQAGGKQTFPVLIPQDMVPGTISVEPLDPAAGNGKSEALRASTPDLEIRLYLDGSHRLTRIEVPSSGVVIERE